jgi:zinc D-Ala-D-Ala carboxypeptidase
VSTPLSTHFTLEEMVHSQDAARLGIDNTPSLGSIANLTTLCALLLEPIRARLGVPISIDSGYRSPALNAQVGGSADSAHMTGCAADCIPQRRDLATCFAIIQKSGLPFDQLIFECNEWLHIGMAQPGAVPRGECLLASGGPGAWTYYPAPAAPSVA